LIVAYKNSIRDVIIFQYRIIGVYVIHGVMNIILWKRLIPSENFGYNGQGGNYGDREHHFFMDAHSFFVCATVYRTCFYHIFYIYLLLL